MRSFSAANLNILVYTLHCSQIFIDIVPDIPKQIIRSNIYIYTVEKVSFLFDIHIYIHLYHHREDMAFLGTNVISLKNSEATTATAEQELPNTTLLKARKFSQFPDSLFSYFPAFLSGC